MLYIFIKKNNLKIIYKNKKKTKKNLILKVFEFMKIQDERV